MAEMGRILVVLGVALVVIGGIVMLLGRTGMPLGRLPGDFLHRGKNTTLYFPLASSILISIVLSLVLFLFGRMKRKGTAASGTRGWKRSTAPRRRDWGLPDPCRPVARKRSECRF